MRERLHLLAILRQKLLAWMFLSNDLF
jgi:hypothetical protein